MKTFKLHTSKQILVKEIVILDTVVLSVGGMFFLFFLGGEISEYILLSLLKNKVFINILY